MKIQTRTLEQNIYIKTDPLEGEKLSAIKTVNGIRFEKRWRVRNNVPELTREARFYLAQLRSSIKDALNTNGLMVWRLSENRCHWIDLFMGECIYIDRVDRETICKVPNCIRWIEHGDTCSLHETRYIETGSYSKRCEKERKVLEAFGILLKRRKVYSGRYHNRDFLRESIQSEGFLT